ncbi:hypothetical protein QP027_03465 [Corynebacterium breve]|uniref:Uncharacterized protein n=1 Tax=Corynebacterium breve TaxID=3049799 RepID=A0ABY8VIM5_9CORY|nr:hypothetical protein [Corynebacterium breve]WIM68468.1 hypothetical protein QP027_03465 [Corynebacterium breve]
MRTRTICRIPDHGLGAIRDVPLTLLDAAYLKWRLDSSELNELDLEAELFESSKTDGLVVLIDERPVAVLEPFERRAYFELDRVVDRECIPLITVRITPYEVIARLPRPGLCLPINHPPQADWVIAPPGPLRTVRFDRPDVIDDPRRRAQVFVALHPRGDDIEVALDGERIGVLEPEDSEALLPLARELQQLGVLLVARAYQAPLGTQATLTFYASPVDDISTLIVNPFTVVTSDGAYYPGGEPTVSFAAAKKHEPEEDDNYSKFGAPIVEEEDVPFDAAGPESKRRGRARKATPGLVAAAVFGGVILFGAGAAALIGPDQSASEEPTQQASVTTSEKSTTSSPSTTASSTSTPSPTTTESSTPPPPPPPVEPPPPPPVAPEVVEAPPSSFEEYAVTEPYIPPQPPPPPPPVEPPPPPPPPPLSPEEQFVRDLEDFVDSIVGP